MAAVKTCANPNARNPVTTFVFSDEKADPEDEQVQTVRFPEYHERLAKLEAIPGLVEPLALKAIRPFLLANEVMKSSSGKSGKGKNKGGKETCKTYTFSQTVPASSKILPANKVYSICSETINPTALTTSTTVPTFYSRAFQVSDLDLITSLVSVFDQYRIDAVEVWFECSTSLATSNGAQDLYTVIDYDDANNLTSLNTALDYGNVMVSPHGEHHYRKFHPHVAVAAYSGTFTSFLNSPAQWIDAASANVQHFGFKVAAGVTTSATISYNLRIRYWTSWRNVR